jgi:hypothetical protein
VAILSLLCAYAFFIEYLPPFKRVFLWSDIGGFHYPLQVFAFRSLQAGRFPMWDSSIYCGISFVGNIQAALFYPLTWLLYAAAWSAGVLHFKPLEVFALAHIWIAFLLSYRWLRDRSAPMPSALGALVFSASGYLSWQLLHLGVLGGMTWLPLGLWGIDQAGNRRDWRPLWKLAAASALAFLAGYPAAWLADCAVWLVYALASRGAWRAAARACAALLGSLPLAAVQLLPTLDARSLMFSEVKYGPGFWTWKAMLLSYLLPNWFDFNPGHSANYLPDCVYFYAGLPFLFAAFWAIRRHEWRPYAQPLAVLVAAFLLAHPPILLIRAVQLIPALNYTMQPGNFHQGIAAMLALITALGLGNHLAGDSQPARKLPRWFVAVIVVLACAWSFHQLTIWARGGQFPAHFPAIAATAIALAVFCLALWAFRNSQGRACSLLALSVLLTAVVDFKVYSAGRWFNALPGDNDDFQSPAGIRGMSSQAFAALDANRSYRIMCDESASPYPTDLREYNLSTPQGFDPFLPDQYRDWIARRVAFRTPRIFFLDIRNQQMLRSLGVRYIITHQGVGADPFLAGNPDYRLVGPDDSFYRVYESQHARAPYYWADQDEGSASPVQWAPERRELQVSSQAGGRFGLVEQFFPGWRATVDSRPVRIERFDGAFQSILVPPGAHRIVFRFLPASLMVGAIVSSLALVALLTIAVWDMRLQSH